MKNTINNRLFDLLGNPVRYGNKIVMIKSNELAVANVIGISENFAVTNKGRLEASKFLIIG